MTNEQRWEFLYLYGTLLARYGATAEKISKGQALLVKAAKKIGEGEKYYEAALTHYSAASARLSVMKEQAEQAAAAYARAEAAGTAAAYAEYLAVYPQGRHAAAAEEKRKERAAEEEARQAEEAEEKKKVIEAARLKELLGEMVHVQGGTFRMGCTAEQEDCDDDEKPVHRVRVSDFEIGQYEVTQAQWEAVMGENPSEFMGCLSCPVENVSWNDVQTFLEELNELAGEEYRLPTEAEWEYAARGGQRSEGYQYAGSDRAGSVGWYRKNSGHEPHPVGQKRPNELGLYDMSGNVTEWTQDCWNEDYLGAPANGRAWKRGDCSMRVLRGGSWGDRPRELRSANRYGDTAWISYVNVGVRLARTLTP